VRDDRVNAALGDAAAEQHDLVVRQRAGAPLAGGLREDLQRLALRGDRAIDRAR
jgi:hypothetical protein